MLWAPAELPQVHELVPSGSVREVMRPSAS